MNMWWTGGGVSFICARVKESWVGNVCLLSLKMRLKTHPSLKEHDTWFQGSITGESICVSVSLGSVGSVGVWRWNAKRVHRVSCLNVNANV